MVLSLILDAIRRRWLIGAFAVFQLFLIFKIPLKIWPASDGMAWTMTGAWFLTIGVGELFTRRELYQLPVSRRTWWLVRWWLSLTGPVAMALVATTFAYWETRSDWPSADYLVLSLVFAVFFCGCGMALEATSFGRSGEAPATIASAILFALVMIGFMAAPFLLSLYLPRSFAGVDATTVILLMAMAAATGYGYRHTPSIEARPDMRLARRFPSSNGPAPVVDMTPAGFAGRLTGFRLVLWDECRKQLILFSSLIALGVAYWAIASLFRSMPALVEFLRLAAVMPFTSSRATIAEPMVFGAIVVVVTLMDPGLVANIRSLRTLPISSFRLGCIPAGLGLTSAAMLWVVLLALHGLLTGTVPASLRPDLFVAFAALAALGRTIRFITPGQTVVRSMLSFAPVALTWLAFGYWSDSWRPDVVQPAALIGGLLALAASWTAMRYAVVWSAAMYRLRQTDARPTA